MNPSPSREERNTPEEKLLKIIENPATEKARPLAQAKAGVYDIQKALFRFKGLRLDKDFLKSINPQMINRAVMALCGVITLVFVVDFAKLEMNLNKKYRNVTSESAVVAESAQNAAFIKEMDVQEILARAKKRNMFTFTPVTAGARGAIASANLQEIMGNLKLVGIIWSDKPQAMIESVKDQKTYLLNKGEQIDTLTIKKIYKEKVILGKDSQEWELR